MGLSPHDAAMSITSRFAPFTFDQPGLAGAWIVNSGNVWKFDNIGWISDAVTYYRNPTSPSFPPPPLPVPCGTTFPQRRTIKALQTPHIITTVQLMCWVVR